MASIVTRERRCCGFFLGVSDSVRMRGICEYSREADLVKIPRMRTFEYRLRFALALVGVLLAGQSAACEPPPGFVNPSRPDIGPLDELLAHTEQLVIAREFSELMKIPSRPLQETIRPMKDMPGVSGTFRLSNGPYGSVGARRLVCLTDGSIAVEEVLLTESRLAIAGASGMWSGTTPERRCATSTMPSVSSSIRKLRLARLE